jgi:hypothetical protein
LCQVVLVVVLAGTAVVVVHYMVRCTSSGSRSRSSVFVTCKSE